MLFPTIVPTTTNCTSNFTIDSSCTDLVESKTEVIVYSLLFFLASSGNIPVFISLFRGRRRASNINEMIFHLTIVDLIVTFVLIPLEISWRIAGKWIAGDTLCRIMFFFRAFGPYSSSMILACISINQFIAIAYPVKVNETEKRVRWMLRYAWAGSFVCSIPQSIIFHMESHPIYEDFKQCVSSNFFAAEYQKMLYEILCILVLYGGPLIVFLYCYCRIMWIVCQQSNLTENTSCDSCSQTNRFNIRLSNTRQIEKKRSRTLKMNCILVFSFVCCWSPYVITDLWCLFGSKCTKSRDVRIQSFMFMFAVFNFCVSPVVYSFYFLDFKDTLINSLHWPLKIKYIFCKSSTQLDSRRMFRDPLGVETRLDNILPSPDGICLELQQASPKRQRVNV
ncbi:gonadotropin-releasing hormone II receptor [Nephila pilipes]|uniref:Gonadotropin-releasing hormone II receptor n=1 Tax=Nephila pilipes TaxID=299642 RepID=A0A8X6IC05_NEPPI|nr:gonadotropin-releasing hormone II receptor [Nephila pilipes]